MTRDDIIRAAREAGFRTGNITLSSGDPMPFVAPLSATTCIVELERFAALIEAAATEKANELADQRVAAEREACAKACDDSVSNFGEETEWARGYIEGIKDVAEGIRDRGAEKWA